MITISWLRLQDPTVKRKEKIKDVFYMENITARLQLKTDVFLSKQAPFVSNLFK